MLWRFARAVARANVAPFELRIVTTEAYEIAPGERTSPAGAALSGFCKALVREMPQVRAACIDLGRSDAAPGADERRVAAPLAPLPTSRSPRILPMLRCAAASGWSASSSR